MKAVRRGGKAGLNLSGSDYYLLCVIARIK